MMKEYRAAAWVKLIFGVNSCVLYIGIWGLFQKPTNEALLLIIIDIFSIFYGLYFFLMLFVIFKWPRIELDDNSITLRRIFKKTLITNLSRHKVEYKNCEITLTDGFGQKTNLGAIAIGRKSSEELYSHLVSITTRPQSNKS